MNFKPFMEQKPAANVPDTLPVWDGRSVGQGESPGPFDGFWDALTGIVPSAAYELGSASLGTLSAFTESATAEAVRRANALGYTNESPDEFAKRQAEQLDAGAKILRERAEAARPDPETTGYVSQLIHGAGTELVKAAGAGVLSMGNPGAAALLYGAQHGIVEAQRAKDQGVDEKTAADIGVSSFVAGTVGMLIPARFGSTRLSSAAFGAIANPVASISEEATVKTILQRADYQDLAAQRDPFDPLNLAVQAVLGGAFGAVAGGNAPRRAPKRAADIQSEKPSDSVQTAIRNAADQAPTREVAQPARVEAIQEASQLRMNEAGVVLQNRNRNTASSIAQMQSIAGSPDYNLVSISRRFESGAPAIAYGDSIPQEQLGRVEHVSASDGTKMEMRYAVVEAEQLQASNAVDGSRNPTFGVVQKNVTIAGNGRVAGITEAYRRGTAAKYREDLIADADAYGVSRGVVESMNHPVLVRVMRDQDARRPDIAMLSNESGTKALDATEQAENDAARIDLSALQFDEEGNITPETVRQFAALVPDSSSILDRQGVPNSLARPRLERAIFQRAYGNANLTSLVTEADGAARNLVNILTRLAPKMMQLEGTGDLDFRDSLVAAVNEVYAEKASGNFVSMKELAAQRPMGRSPETQAFLDYFATLGTKTNEPVQVFNHLVDWSVANNPSEVGLFSDDAPTATRVDLLQEFSSATGIPVDAESIAGLSRTLSHWEQVQTIKKTIVERLQNLNHFRENTNVILKDSREKIQGIVSRVLRGKGSNSQGKDSFSDYLPVSQDIAERIKSENNIDVSGYVHSITDSSVIHALNQHGVGKERRADQIPITEEDFNRLPEVVGDPDTVRLSDKKTARTQQEALTYTKEFPDGVTYVVEEIRKGRKKLMFHTAYKKVPSTPRATSQDGMASRQRPKRIEGDLYSTSLRSQSSSSKFSKEQIEAQANLWSTAVVRLAEQVGVEPIDILPKIKFSESTGGEGLSGDVPSNRQTAITSGNAESDVFNQIAFHGSPHVFDQFSTDAIGTGEGAQAHGWGLYFAEDKSIAENYRNVLLARGGGPESGGRVFEVDVPENDVLLDEGLRFNDQPPLVRQAILRLIPEYAKPTPDRELYQTIQSRSLSIASNEYKFSSALRNVYQFAKKYWKYLQDDLHQSSDKENELIESLSKTMRRDGDYRSFIQSLYPEYSPERIDRVIQMNTPNDGALEYGMADVIFRAIVKSFVKANDRGLGDTDGRSIYRNLSNKFHGAKAASLALKKEGVEGITYEGATDGRCYVIFDENAIKLKAFWSNDESRAVHFNQAESSRQSGAQMTRGQFSPSRNEIRLTPNADITTFSHEMGHWWLMNAIEASKRQDVDAGLRRDVKTLLDTFGIKDATAWDALGTDGQRAYHEQFASWVEEFLVTGRPHNDAVRGILEKFRAWITSIYRDFRAHLEGRYRNEFGQELPPLSDEVREVLDRALAYEDSLSKVQREFSPTHAVTDSARYANFNRQIQADQLADGADAQSMNESMFAEEEATRQMNSGERVEVSPRIDVERVQGAQQALVERLDLQETLKPRPEDGAPMPVTAPPPHPLPSGDVAATDGTSQMALESSPDVIVDAQTLDGEKTVTTARDVMDQAQAEADEINRFAAVLGDAAQCIWRNGGFK